MKSILNIFLFSILLSLSTQAEKKLLYIIAGHDEKHTEKILPRYAEQVFANQFDIELVISDPKKRTLPDLQGLQNADLLIISANHLKLNTFQLEQIKKYLLQKKPLICIAANQAFSPEKSPEENHPQWLDFSYEILGCAYKGFHQSNDNVYVKTDSQHKNTVLLKGLTGFRTNSKSVKIGPLRKGSKTLLWAQSRNQSKYPVAWVTTTNEMNKIFATTLGHPEDFTKRSFQKLIYRAVFWGLNKKIPTNVPAFKFYNPYVEEHFPFFTSTLDARNTGPCFPEKNLSARGIILKPGHGHFACFDTDLLRYSLFWKGAGISMNSMATGSYHLDSRSKKSAMGEKSLPVPLGTPIIALGQTPGIEANESTWKDPRPAPLDTTQLCNGPIPKSKGQWNGIMLTEEGAVLSYSIGKSEIFETLKATNIGNSAILERRIKVINAQENLFFHIGEYKNCEIATFKDFVFINQPGKRTIAIKVVSNNLCSFTNLGAKIDLEVSADREINLSLYIWEGPEKDMAAFKNLKHVPSKFPDLNRTPMPYWPDSVKTKIIKETDTDDELISEDLELPILNKSFRNVRISGIDFFPDGTAAACTFDGDIWIIKGLTTQTPIWKRFASGLNEPQNLVVKNNKIYVFDRNGVIRLHDRNNNGEADFYENFCNLPIQTAETREFALDLKLLPDGSFVIAKGGQRQSTLTPHAGTIIHISSNGKKITPLASGLREPYLGVDFGNGDIFASDQQGHWVPATPFHRIKKGADYGYKAPFITSGSSAVTEPITWIPHRMNQSGAGIIYLKSSQMGHLKDKLLYLDYTGPSLGAIYYNSERPQQAAFLKLKKRFQFPLLKGAVNPIDGKVYLTGFQIWGTKAKRLSGLCRISPNKKAPSHPTAIRYFKQGILLSFAKKINPESINPNMIYLERWNYLRSSSYGSSHFNLSGKKGQERIGLSSVTLSKDQSSVFIAIPDMKKTMQMLCSWRFLANDNKPMTDTTYFSINTLDNFEDLNSTFPTIDFNSPELKFAKEEKTSPSIELGKSVAVKMGCTVCHATNKETEPKTGPAWHGLYESERILVDDKKVIANDNYLKESILAPTAKVVKGYAPAMLPYEGVLKDFEIESIILFIKSLK